MRVVFCGTPEFSVPSLERLASEHEVVCVVSQPDKPFGRKQLMTPPPVAQAATKLGLKLIQTKSINKLGIELAAMRPDVLVVVAFGQLLKADTLAIAMPINAHASLLPRHRGASPIQAAILAGDAETGVCVMKMEAGLDTGPVMLRRAIPIPKDATAGSLHDSLAALSADCLSDALKQIEARTCVWEAQNDALATTCGKIVKSDGVLDWTEASTEIERRIRAMTPWPGAWTFYGGRRIRIAKARLDADGHLLVERVQLEGGREMSLTEFHNGRKDNMQRWG